MKDTVKETVKVACLFSITVFSFLLTQTLAKADVRVRQAPLPAKPRVLSTADLGVIERESQHFTAPESAVENPIPEIEDNAGDGSVAEELTLDQSINLGVQGATEALKTQNANRYAGEALLQSYAEFLPTLDAGGVYQVAGGKTLITEEGPTVVDSRNYGPSYNVTASLNIFNGFADIAQLKAEHERKDAAELNLTRAKQEIALDVAQSFYQVVLDQDMIEIAKKNLAASQAQQKLIAASTNAGIRSKADLYQQQAQTASDESYYTNTQDRKRTDLILLLRKLRLDVHKNYRVSRPKLPDDAKADPKYANEGQLIDIALKHRPDLTSYRDVADATHHEVTIAAAPYLPKLNFSVGVEGDARHYDSLYVDGQNLLPPTQQSIASQLGNQVGWVAGLTLTWNILDHGLTRLSAAQAQVTADNADIDQVDKEKQVTGEVRQTLGDYRAALQQLASSQTGLFGAQKGYEVVRGRYEVGAASFVDLITAQSLLVRAEGARSQAVVGYQLQIRSMETALGTSVW